MSNFVVISWPTLSYIWWDDGDVHFVLDLHDELDLYSASSLKQCAGRHDAPVGHIIPIVNQPVFDQTP